MFEASSNRDNSCPASQRWTKNNLRFLKPVSLQRFLSQSAGSRFEKSQFMDPACLPSFTGIFLATKPSIEIEPLGLFRVRRRVAALVLL